jgi:hypothetical protein
MLPYPKFVQFVKQVFGLSLRKTRLENLQLLVFGLLRGRSCSLSRIARFFPLPTDHNHRLRRLWRFLKNPGFVPEQLYPQLIRALAPCWPASLPLPLALDWTSAGGYELLVASLPWRGRALPLWALCCAGKWKDLLTSRNHLEEALISAVVGAWRAVRPEVPLVWIADRGFARLNLLQFLAQLGVDFAIRVDAKTKIAWSGQKLLLSELSVKPGQLLWLEGVIYRPEGRPFERGGIRVNLLVAWKRAKKQPQKGLEPWYVVTTLESLRQTLAYYRRRMRIDEGFKDWKQRLGLRQAAVSQVERLARLMVGLVLATLVLALLGLFGLPAGFHRAVLGRGKGSWLWLALQLLEQAKPPELGQALRLAANLGGLR